MPKILNSNQGLILFYPMIGPIPGASYPGLSGPGSDGNKLVLRIPQSSSIARTSPSDCLVSYPGHTMRVGSFPSAEKYLVYSTDPADWVMIFWTTYAGDLLIIGDLCTNMLCILQNKTSEVLNSELIFFLFQLER